MRLQVRERLLRASGVIALFHGKGEVVDARVQPLTLSSSPPSGWYLCKPVPLCSAVWWNLPGDQDCLSHSCPMASLKL